MLVNENPSNVPKINPMKELYWKQFGGGPDEKLLKRMEPKGTDETTNPPKKNKKAKKAK
jgi:arylsulfatase